MSVFFFNYRMIYVLKEETGRRTSAKKTQQRCVKDIRKSMEEDKQLSKSVAKRKDFFGWVSSKEIERKSSGDMDLYRSKKKGK